MEKLWFDPNDMNQIITLYKYYYDYRQEKFFIKTVKCNIQEIKYDFVDGNVSKIKDVVFVCHENGFEWHIYLSRMEKQINNVERYMYSRFKDEKTIKFYKDSLIARLTTDLKTTEERIADLQDSVEWLNRQIKIVEEANFDD